MEYVIETHQLMRRFGTTNAVSDLCLQVPPGSVYAFLGSNGAGKTTTIKMLMNVIKPTFGTARVLGRDSSTLDEAIFQQIGYVSENQKLPEWMTVQRFIDYCRPFYPTWDDAFCASLLKQFDLPLDRKLSGLSRGMKVKAALVSSLAYRPKLLILDEPFTGLDVYVRDEFIRGVLELSGQSDWTIFVSSHDIDEVERLCDWVGLISRGELKIQESVESLQQRFRRIDFALPAGDATPPLEHPPSWQRVEMAGHGGQIIDTAYEEGTSEQRVFACWPTATNLTVSSLSLRDLFLELARQERLTA